MNIQATIYMEYANEYTKFLKVFISQLNTQSLYRGEKFNIENYVLVPENEQIRVDLCDIVLVIIRIILNFEKVNSTM